MQGRQVVVAVAIAFAMAACGTGTDSGVERSDHSGTSSPTTPATVQPAGPVHHLLLASDGARNDYFGGDLWYNNFVSPVEATYYATPGEAAMSSAGDLAVVGAPGHSNGAKTGAGAVYVFTREGTRFTQTAKLVARDGAAYDGFGWSVALSGDGRDLVVGAPYDDVGRTTDVGSMYIFHRSGTRWTQVASTRPTEVTAYDGFGFSVAISRDGSTVVAGAPSRAIEGHKGQGAAYGFKRVHGKWTQQYEIHATAGGPQDDFGAAAALSADGSTVLVTKATHTTSDKVVHYGGSYIFRASSAGGTPRQVASFPDSNRNADHSSDAYGVNASLSDDGRVGAVAAPDVNVGKALGAGAEYVYTTTGNWSVASQNATTTIVSPNPASYAYYGSCGALSSDGSTLWIGVDGVGTNGQGGGDLVRAPAGTPAAWRSLTALQHTNVDAPSIQQGRFGTAVAVSADGRTLLSTAPWLPVKGTQKQGAAYVTSMPKATAP